MLKNFKLPIVFFCFFQSFLFAQNNTQLDSLKSVVNSSETTSDDLIKTALKIAKLNRRTNPEEQLLYAKKAYDEASKISDKKMQGITLSEIANYHQKQDNYDSAYYYFNKTLKFFQKPKNRGNVYSRLSNIEKARGNYVKSIQLLITSDSIYETIDFKTGRLQNNINLGIILSTKGDYKEAISYYKKAEALLEEKDYRYKSNLYTNFAITYNHLGDLDNSKKYTKQSLVIKETLNDVTGIANAYANLAMIASKENDDDLSVNYMESALTAYKKTNNKNSIASSYKTLGDVYRKKGNYKKAEDYLLKANTIAQSIENHNGLMSNQKSLYQLYRDKKQWDKAYLHLESYNSLKDSITAIEKIKVMEDLETKYKTKNILQDKVLAEANSELAEQKAATTKNYAIAISALAALVLAVILLLFSRFKTKKKEEALSLELVASQKRLKLEQQTRVSELKALQSQMNPHFMFNALNSIQDLILMQDIRNSNKYLGKFSDLIRRVLVASSDGTITINQEIEMLKLYAELEQLRFGDQLKIYFKNEIAEDISDDFNLPPMFLQPYLENALKHGLLHKEGLKILNVSFYTKADYVVCKIDDNGVGRLKAETIKRKVNGAHLGFSTEANEERLQLLNKDKAKDIYVEIEDKMALDKSVGTNVFVNFPFEESYQ